MAWRVALSIAAHAAIALNAWHGAVPTETPRTARLHVRLLERSPRLAAPAAAVAMAAKVKHDPVAPRRTAVAGFKAPAIAPAAALATELIAATGADIMVEAPPRPAEALDGAVFGLPRISFSGPASTTWTRPAPPLPSPIPPAQPDPTARAHARREAGRSQLVAALEQQLSALQTPVGSGDGSCALDARPQPRLDCDNDALRDAVTPRAAALSGLLQAYRSMDSRAGGLSIGFSQGRYQVVPAMGTEPGRSAQSAQ